MSWNCNSIQISIDMECFWTEVLKYIENMKDLIIQTRIKFTSNTLRYNFISGKETKNYQIGYTLIVEKNIKTDNKNNVTKSRKYSNLISALCRKSIFPVDYETCNVT